MNKLIRFVLSLGIAWLMPLAFAAPPQTINYQGYLTNPGGTPVNSAVVMTFRLYSVASGGAALWTETQLSVNVTSGNFNTVLGATTPITLPFDVPYWLTVAINADGEMSPRQPLASSPYAFRAASLDSAATVAGMQIGGVITNATLPTGNLSGALGTTQIANNAVTQDKLSPVAGAAAGKVLGTDGSNLQWQTTGLGTVTSVNTGTGITGGPITGSGTINLAATQLLPAATCAANQITKWNGSTWACAADNDTNNTANDARYFKQDGNAFGATALLGTTDANPLQLIVGGASALRLEPNGTSPNHVAGYSANSVTTGAVGASIGGGGLSGSGCGSIYRCKNQVTDDYGTVGGGIGNVAGDGAGSTSDVIAATVGGGHTNTASGHFSTVGGGASNTASLTYSTVGGGDGNSASGPHSTVGGGYGNSASGPYSTVGGGQDNTASGLGGTVSGGILNSAGDYSFAAGRRAKANQRGMFVWADTWDLDFDMTQWRGALNQSDNTFNVRATGLGGVYFATGVNGSTGQPTWACYTSNGNGWTCTSDRDVKRNLRPIDTQDALAKVSQLPVYRWQPRTGPNSELDHIGPMAQDFYAAFGLGDSDKSIGLLDAAGVALAAIQGLNLKLEAELRAMDERSNQQEVRILQLENALVAIQINLGLK